MNQKEALKKLFQRHHMKGNLLYILERFEDATEAYEIASKLDLKAFRKKTKLWLIHGQTLVLFHHGAFKECLHIRVEVDQICKTERMMVQKLLIAT
jgi:hypothetical protein